jgi:hypothetical protein
MNILNTMIDRTINNAGEWNAQLFRELKGRLSLYNSTLTLSGSFFAQAILMLIFFGRLPVDPKPGESNSTQDYCFSIYEACKLDKLGHVITNWPHWWTDILIATSWAISTILVVGGIYFLVSDLRREESRGTLNFVRLSPQSAANVFIGKLLGVPILIYLAVASILPLQLVAGANSFGVVNTLVFDGLCLSIAALFYLGAMLLVTITPVMPIGIALLAWWLQSSVGMMMQFNLNSSSVSGYQNHDNDPTWFYLPIFSNAITVMLFTIFSCGVTAYAIWRMLCRRYTNPNDTLISKKQSYQLNAVLQTWLLGWAIPLSIASPHVTKDILMVVSFVDIFFAYILISTIIPRRDVLQDWCRQTDLRVKKGFVRWWPDLIWDDRSPALIALAINLAIPGAIWVLLGFLRSAPEQILPLAGLMLLVMLNIGIAAQISHTHNLPRYLNPAIVTIICILQMLMLSVINSLVGEQFPNVKLFIALTIESTLTPLLIGLMWKRLRSLGRSDSQEMFKTA